MARLRSRGAFSLTRSPAMSRSPDEMSSSPTIIRSTVDFPQPDGPTRIMNSPSAISRLTSFTAWKPSAYFFSTFFSVMAAIFPQIPSQSALDRTGGQSRDDLALEQQNHDHNRYRHHHG